jgi:hypothetical protein
LFLVTLILQRWEARKTDFVLGFPQADAECDIGFVEGKEKGLLSQAEEKHLQYQTGGRVWNKHDYKGLLKLRAQG